MLNLLGFRIKNKSFPGIIDGRRIFIPVQPSAFAIVPMVKVDTPLVLELVISTELVMGWLLLDRWLVLYGRRGLTSLTVRFGRGFVRVCERAVGTPEGRRCARPPPKEEKKKKPAVFAHAKNNHSWGREDGLSLMETSGFFPKEAGIPVIKKYAN